MALILSVVALLLGCSSPFQPAETELPALHLPHVVQLDAIARLRAESGAGQVTQLAAYRVPGTSSDERIIVELDGTLYDVGLDGRNARPIPTVQTCDGPIAVTPDGNWIACQDALGVEIAPLQPGSGSSAQQILANDTVNDFRSPTWSQDGHALAVVSRAGVGCGVDIYQVSRGYDALRLSVVLVLTQFVEASGSGPGCSVFGLTWSPDGSWLALVARGVDSTIYGLSLAHVWPLLEPADESPRTLPATASQLMIWAGTSSFTPTWSESDGRLTLTFIAPDHLRVLSLDIATGRVATLLGLPRQQIGGVCEASWTPSGLHLIFVQCFPGAGDLRSLPSSVYVYTPSSG